MVGVTFRVSNGNYREMREISALIEKEILEMRFSQYNLFARN